jgi:hypothetical protein
VTRGGLALNPEDPPILVCADLQAQYLNEIAGPEAARCLALLELWRAELWPVMHLKRIAQAAWFDPSSDLTDWSAAFRPKPGEMVFEHSLPSAYSSSRFAEYMANMKDIRCVMAGCSLDETILATVVDGFHRGCRFHVVGDAVTCSLSADGDPEGYRGAIMRAIGKFAGLERSRDLIEAATGAA